MQPRVLRASESNCQLVTLLAWDTRSEERHLLGFWGFSIGKPHLSILPVAALCAPVTDHAYLSAPVIDRDRLEHTLHAMLDTIAQAPRFPKLLALESMSGSGRTYQALMRVLAERSSPFCQLDGKNRPKLLAGPDAGDYLTKALSASTRKKLRQQRRRLGEKGTLRTTVVHSVADVRRAFQTFLALEAQGWKGRRRTALLNDPNEAAFASNMVTALARTGDAAIYALELDGRPVSMQVVLRAGGAAYTWKTAYDEAFGEFSPGMLLLEDYSKAFLADPDIAFVDSCAFDDSGYMAAWTERMLVIDLWIDARRGGSTAFSAIAGLQKTYLPLRESVKHVYLRSAAAQALRRVLSGSWRSSSKGGESDRNPSRVQGYARAV